MFQSGWGFHTHIEELAVAAFVWQRAIRPLRLVRLRHLARLKEGRDAVNLASLPQELLEIIEDCVMEAVYSHSIALTAIPIVCPCDEFYAGFSMWPPLAQAEADFVVDNMDTFAPDYLSDEEGFYSPLLDGIDWEMASAEFHDTEIFDELFDEYMDIHRAHGICEAEQSRIDAWELIVSKNKDIPEQSRDKKQVLEILDALRLFEQDFGLLRICPRHDPDFDEAYTKTAVLFAGHSQATRREPSQNKVIELPHNLLSRFTRFLKILRLPAPWYGPSVLAADRLLWIAADMNDKEFGEIEVLCKSRKSVEEHNSDIEHTRKKTAEKRSKRSKK